MRVLVLNSGSSSIKFRLLDGGERAEGLEGILVNGAVKGIVGQATLEFSTSKQFYKFTPCLLIKSQIPFLVRECATEVKSLAKSILLEQCLFLIRNSKDHFSGSKKFILH